MTAFDPARVTADFAAALPLSPQQAESLTQLAGSLNLGDMLTVTSYGAKEQRDLGDVSANLLRRAQGPAMDKAFLAIEELLNQVHDLKLSELEKPGGLFGFLSPAKRHYRMLQTDFERISLLVDRLADQLDLAWLGLSKESAMLDTLYEANLQGYRDLNSRIIAGEMALQMAQQVQHLHKDKAYQLELFEKRLHELRTTRAVSQQMALQIRLTQFNQQVVMDKLRQTLDQALPLWQNQLALALNLHHQQTALRNYRSAANKVTHAMQDTTQAIKQGSQDTKTQTQTALSAIDQLKQADFALQQIMQDALGSVKNADEKPFDLK